MREPLVQKSRIRVLNQNPVIRGAYILYWMQQSQRAEGNHALSFAAELAGHYRLPLLVVFGLMPDYPEATRRHYTFMLQGLRETRDTLAGMGIKLIVVPAHPVTAAVNMAKQAAALVCDRGYLRHQRAWRRQVAEAVHCRVIEVESDVVIPVQTISPKREYAARTIRPKIHKLLGAYLMPVPPVEVPRDAAHLDAGGLDLDDGPGILARLQPNPDSTALMPIYKGGTGEARRRLADFIANRLTSYVRHRNQPQTDDISHMSPYLHFGQISPVEIALEIRRTPAELAQVKDAYLEELIVRRELAVNFVYYTPNYDAYASLPSWCRDTLDEHARDRREPVYAPAQLVAAQTHDPYWNAAMLEMKHTGFMHNYMRMYWAKKILEWSPSPREAFDTALHLNNTWLLDGRDPNSHAGVAWAFGLHDRPWKERPIFGKVRYMAASGLERKCDIAAYVQKIDQMVQAGRPISP